MARTADGTQLEVSTTLPATYDEAGYEALTFTPVGAVFSIGEIGETFADVTSYDLGNRGVKHLKGSRDTTETPIVVDTDRGDAGQIILRDHHNGSKTDDPVAVKITHQNGDVEYYTAGVFTFNAEQLAQDTIYRSNISMRINDGTQVFVEAV